MDVYRKQQIASDLLDVFVDACDDDDIPDGLLAICDALVMACAAFGSKEKMADCLRYTLETYSDFTSSDNFKEYESRMECQKIMDKLMEKK